MFSTTIRLQARPVLVAQKLARTATVSASQSFSRLALRSALSQQALPLLRGVAGVSSRSFSQSAPVNLGHSIQPNVPSRVLFVGNIPWSSTKEELQELFREFGDILSVRIREFFFFFLLSHNPVSLILLSRQTLMRMEDLVGLDILNSPQKNTQ